MTAVATAMAGKLVAFTPKRVGRSVRAGKSCGTLESGKWVGPAKSAAGGEVVAVNDDLVGDPASPTTILTRPAGWSSSSRMTGTRSRARWSSGSDVTAPYEAKMDAEGFGGCA